MKATRLYSSFLLAAAFAVILFTASVRAEEGVTITKFSDPAKPGTLKILVGRGDVRITGADTAEVTVKSEAKPVTQKPRKDGLRVITASSSYLLKADKDNVITLDALSEGWAGAPSDFRITVPRGTNINMASSYGGDITCRDVTGDLEINCLNGEVHLDGIAGSAIVSTTNGEILANVRELHEGKALSFTSMNGEVVVRVPADAKANVRLRTQNGQVLTDFDEKVLVTKTENNPRGSRRITVRTPNTGSASHQEIQQAVHEAVRASVQAAREIAVAAKEAAEAARAGAEAARSEMADVPVPPVPPLPPQLPPITGGKLVTGTLNGGGPEISVASMNGDVTLRQSDAKK